LRALSLSSEGRLPETIEEIGRIMTAIERKDGAAAAQACRAHMEAAAEVALRILAQREVQPGAAAGER
jgi:DNA-binding GntR family transcriptional regulator